MSQQDDSPSIPALFWEVRRRLVADEAIPLAGNIAFRIVFSAFPFLIFLTALAGFFGNADWAEKVVNFLLSVAPETLVKPLSGEIRSILTVQRSGLLSIAALLTVWSAMGGVDSVRVGLNRAYNVTDHRSIWLLYSIDVLFVVVTAIVLLAIALLIIVFPVGMKIVSATAGGLPGALTQIDQYRYLLALILLTAGVYAAHRVLPAKRLYWRDILPGALLTVITWIIMAEGFSLWLLHFNSFASTYASLSGIFAAMFFVYMAALLLILGGELNRVLQLVRQRRL
jgi:membrane protein